jgi:hypothetical protein
MTDSSDYNTLWPKFSEQWPIVKAAPHIFAVSILMAIVPIAGSIWYLLSWSKDSVCNSELEGKDSAVASKDGQI